jgi:beta-lactamase class C
VKTSRNVCFLPLTLTLLTLSLPCLAVSPKQLADEYSAFFQSYFARENLVGAAFAVVSRQEIIQIGTAGHTNAERHASINQNTAFRLASVSKTFAAGLVGQLVAEDRIEWDDPVNRYLPDFRIDGDTRKIHVRHLLGQSSGLMPHAYDNLIEDGKSMQQVRKQLAGLQLICSPGRCYGYQNTVFSLVDPMVEKLTSTPYSELMKQKIFQPLDMKTASVGYRPFVNNPNRAEPHVRWRGKWKTVSVLPNYYRVAPAAGVNASILDMAKWVMAQMGHRPDVIAPETVDTLITPGVRTRKELYRKEWRDLLTDAHYGLGWRIYQFGEQQIAYHGGRVSGYRADVAWSDNLDLGIVVLLNTESSRINTLTSRFWKMALNHTETGIALQENDPPAGRPATAP